MYMQSDIKTAQAKVFNIESPCIDPAQRHAEIERVIEIATAAIPKTQMRKLGRLSFASARDDDDHSYFGQIRSEPIDGMGLEFRFPLPAWETGNNDLLITASVLAESAIHVARNARTLRKYVTTVRTIAENALQPATGGIAEMRVTAIGITPGRSAGKGRVTLDVETLGDDLTMGVERICEAEGHAGLNHLENELKDLAAKHVVRCALLAQAKVAGASGWIDDSARCILDQAGLDLADAVTMLRLSRQVDFSFGGEDGFDTMGGVCWDDGVVRGYVEHRTLGNTFRLEGKILTVKASRLPATICGSLVGRTLGEVIKTDFIPANALIVGAEESGGWLHLRLEIGRSTIEEAILS